MGVTKVGKGQLGDPARRLLTDIAIAKACKVKLEGGPGQRWGRNDFFEVRPAAITSISDPPYTNGRPVKLGGHGGLPWPETECR